MEQRASKAPRFTLRYQSSCLVLATQLVLCVACDSTEPAALPDPVSLDVVAEAYVKLALATGRYDVNYIDAYYGPAQWRTDAQADAPVPLPELVARAGKLVTQVHTATGPADRKRYLEKQLIAVQAWLRLRNGTKMTFADECRQLYDITPTRYNEAQLQALRAKADAYPGVGPGIDVAEFPATVATVLALLRQASTPFVELPEGETLELAPPTTFNRGYHHYLGNFRGHVELAVDAWSLDELLATLAHEAYPGHQAFFATREEQLVQGKGWVEHTVEVLYSPESVVAEGTAEVALEVLYTDEQRRDILAKQLAPQLNLNPNEVLSGDKSRVAGAGWGHVLDEAAWQLFAEGKSQDDVAQFIAKHWSTPAFMLGGTFEFLNAYRGYIYTYSTGADLVRAWIGHGPDRRARFRALLENPVVPSDLLLH